MKNMIALTVIAGMVLVGVSAVNADKKAKPEKKLRHVVLFQFTEETTKEEVSEITAKFASLPGRIDAIADRILHCGGFVAPCVKDSKSTGRALPEQWRLDLS